MKKIVKGLFCSVVVFAAGVVRASVPSDGLATAVADAADGAVIELDATTYSLGTSLTIGRGITVKGAGVGETVITASKDLKARMIALEGGATLEGVTVQGVKLTCRDVKGKGVYVTDGTLRNCRVTGFTCGEHFEHGTVCLNGANAQVENCEIDNNQSWFGNDGRVDGGGVYLISGCMTGCHIHGNSANWGGGVYMTGGTLENSLIEGNRCHFVEKTLTTLGTGGGVCMTGGSIVGCTIVGNSSNVNRGIGGLQIDGANCTVTRTIVRGNFSCNSTSAGWPDLAWSNASVESKVTDCCLPVAFGSNCVTNLPMFVDAANGDYRLLPGSPCILAEGQTIGCKSCSETSPACGFTMDQDAVIEGGSIAFTASTVNAAGGVDYTWDFGDGTEAATGATVSHKFTAAGDYTVTLTTAGIATPFQYTVHVGATTVEVANVAELEAAVAAAVDGQTILLTGSEYVLNKTLCIDKAISLIGPNGWANCVLKLKSGVNDRILIIANEHALVKGVTAYNGRLGVYAGASMTTDNISGVSVWINVRGGSFVESRVTAGKTSNYYQQGTLGVTGQKGYVNRCLIDNNNNQKASDGNDWGGGVYVGAGLVENCIISNNTCWTGAGVAVQGGTLRNCTVFKGTALISAGVYATAGIVQNCVFMGGTVTSKDTTSGRPMWSGTRSCFDHCAFVGVEEIPNETCFLMTDPFVESATGNLMPLPGSEGLADKGVDYVGSDDAVDYAGNPRKSGASVDIGAYELDASQFSCTINTPYPTALFVGGSVTFSAELINPPVGADFDYDWTFTDRFGNTVKSTDAEPTIAFAAGWYTADLVLSLRDNPDKKAIAPTRKDLVHVTPKDIYATAQPEGVVYPYDDPTKGSPDLNVLADEAIAGTTIHVGTGTFTISKEVILSSAVTITGDGWSNSVIRMAAGVQQRLFRIDHADAKVEKVTIADGKMNIRSDQGDDGFGISVWITKNGGKLYDCRLTGAQAFNHFQYGVVCIDGVAGHVARCLVDGNNNLFQTTSGDGYGGGIAVRAGLAENCLVTNNNAFTGGGAYVTGGILRNCTFYKNTALKSGGAYAKNSGKIVNCVFMGDTSNDLKDSETGRPEWGGTGSAFENCAFVGIAADKLPGSSSMVMSDPFADATAGDLHPVGGAAGLTDKGQDFDTAESSVDYEGRPRKSGSAVDIGCYELDANQFSCSFDVQDAKTEGFSDETYVLVADITNPPDGVTFGYRWTLTDLFGNVHEDEGKTLALQLAAGTYSVELEVYNVAQPSQKASATPRKDFLHIVPRHLYATAGNPDAAFPYDSPDNGATNLIELLKEAIDGSVVHVGEGTFTNRAEMVLTKKITILGEGYDKSVIRLEGSLTRVLRIANEKALVKGLTLSGGRSKLYGTTQDGFGGGVWITSAGGELCDCRVTDNQSQGYYQYGAGVHVSSSKGVVRRCIIDNNSNLYRETVQHGGGIDVTAGLVENCLVVSNTSGEGAGISISGGTIRNCTIAFNRALTCTEASAGVKSGGYSGGLMMNGGGKVQNCVFFGNTAERDEWYESKGKTWLPIVGYPEWNGSGTELTNCGFADTVTTNATTGGSCVLFAEPGFRDAVGGDFHLLKDSPLVNAGDRLNYTKNDVDLDGNGRITGFNTRKRTKCLPDLGCYESPWGVPGMLLWVR